jgi:cytolysin (calcineurin-like family phosphatase)
MLKIWPVAAAALFLLPLVACGGGDGDTGGDAGVADASGVDKDATVDAAPGHDAGPGDATFPDDAADGAAPLDAAGDASNTNDAGDAAIVDAADAGPVDIASQDITFFAFGDPQFGGGPADKNSFHIQAMNAAPALTWPTDAGFVSTGPVGDPQGVIIAGDLTQNGQAGRDPFNEWYTTAPYQFDMNKEWGVNVPNSTVGAELGLFLRDYGLRGNDGKDPFVLKYRVFEGYGNHDFDIIASDQAFYGGQAPSRDVVSIRNQVRATWPEVRRVAPGNAGHYSWDWGATHFIHVNLVAADGPGPVDDDSGADQGPRDPQGALTFIKNDLADFVGGSCRPVILIMHYGFDPFSEEGRWWDEDQRLAFLKVVHPYNVLAILHGHVHETHPYVMTDAQGKAYQVFSLGSPYYQGQQTNNGRGHFQVFHLKGAHVDAADISWLPANPAPDMGDNIDLWTGKKLADVGFQITTTFSDGWGGWAYSKDIDMTKCEAGFVAPH